MSYTLETRGLLHISAIPTLLRNLSPTQAIHKLVKLGANINVSRIQDLEKDIRTLSANVSQLERL